MSNAKIETLQAQLDKEVAAAADRFGATLDQVGTLCMHDSIVPVGGPRGRMSFEYRPPADDEGESASGTVVADIDGNPLPMTPWATAQAAQRMGIPGSYAKALAYGEPWQRELAAEVLRRSVYHHYAPDDRDGNPDRLLVREREGRVQAVLSDRYRRLDTPTIARRYLETAQSAGLALRSATLDATQTAIEVIYPRVVEVPLPSHGTQALAWGLRLKNSDVGDGALSLSLFEVRIWCSNLMVCESALRQVHLGRRLPNNIDLSDETYRLDTAAQASLVADLTRGLTSAPALQRRIEVLQHAAEDVIEESQIKRLPQLGVSKGEVEHLRTILSENDPAKVPEGPLTRFKLSQAISHVAQGTESDRRRRDLEELAGKLVGAESPVKESK